jgi:alpha-L-fucosidase 2
VGKSGLPLALDSFESRASRGNFGWYQDGVQAAFLGLATDAREDVVARAKRKHAESRCPAFWGPNFDWIPDQDHGGNLMMALQTMLLQADGKKIHVLPAWPKNWDVEFKLHAPKNAIVEGTVRSGKVNICITPEQRKKDFEVHMLQ